MKQPSFPGWTTPPVLILITNMSTPATAHNPFQEVCLYLSRQGNDFALAELIKRFGFTVYAFVSLQRMCAHLEANPLTAAAFIQGNLSELEPQLRKTYHGPLYELAEEKESMLEELGANLREVHRNQMKVQDPKVLRVLKSFDAFTRGAQKTLLLLGNEESLDLAREFLALFLDAPLAEVSQELPEALPSGTGTIYMTRNLFSQPIEFQQNWNLLFGTGECPHIILETKSTDDLDLLYLNGKLDEMLYERLSFRQINVEVLSGHSLEELCVQPLHKQEPRLVFDSEGDPQSESESPAGKVQSTLREIEPKSSTKGLGNFIGRFLKRKTP